MNTNTKQRRIVDTDLIQVIVDGNILRVYLTLSQGGTVEHEPFQNSPEGLVGALMLAADVNAGKFYLRRVMPSGLDLGPKMIEHRRK